MTKIACAAQEAVALTAQPWPRVTLEDVSRISSGTTPPRQHAERYFADGTVPWVKTLDLRNGEIWSTDESVTELALSETSLQVYPTGTVLVAMYGGFGQIGKTGLLRIPACVNQALSAVQVNRKRVVPEYLLAVLNFRVEHWKAVASSSRKDPNITGGDVRAFELALPSLEEQRSIAAALMDVDALLVRLDQLVAKKRDLKQAAMQQLLTGRVRLGGFRGAWNFTSIGRVCHPSSARNSQDRDLPVLSCSKHLGFVESLRYFKNQVFSDDLRGYKIIRRDEIGYPANHIEEGSIGLQDLFDEALVSPIYVVFKVAPEISSYFLHRLLKLDVYRERFHAATSSSVDRRGSLRWRQFAEITVSLPDLREQLAVVEVLRALESELAALEARRDKTRELKQGMMQALLTGRIRLT